jgi:hypothetical protein
MPNIKTVAATKVVRRLDPRSPKFASAFKKAANAFALKTNTPETAHAALVKMGILTQSGRLTKHYR